MNVYDRQIRIEGWDQNRILNSKIGIVGFDLLGQLSLFYLSGLGVKNFYVIDNNKEHNNNLFSINTTNIESLINEFHYFNPELNINYIKGHPRELESLNKLRICDIIIDATNKPSWKENSYEIALRSPYVESFISASTNQTRGDVKYIDVSNTGETFDTESSIYLTLKKERIKRITEARDKEKSFIQELRLEQQFSEEYKFEDYFNQIQGIIPSSYIAALIADYSRFTLVPLESEGELLDNEVRVTPLPTRQSYNILSEKRFMINRYSSSHYSNPPNIYKKKAMVVGAGGIGTYVSLVLSKLGFDIDIYDHDHVELHNLNRQLLYRYDDAYNEKKKAFALAQNLRKINPINFYRGIDRKINDKSMWYINKDYDIIFSCVDNPFARYDLSNIAKKLGIPLINGGVTAFDAIVEFYIPKETPCLNCQNFNYVEAKKRFNNIKQDNNSCFSRAEPSVVITNAIAGTLMANESLPILFEGFPHKIRNKFINYKTHKGDYGCKIANIDYQRGSCDCMR